MSYSRSNIIVHPSTKIECRYCHATDHVKGSFDKKQKRYTLSCPALIAKNNRNSGRSLQHRAITNSHNKRQIAVDTDGFSTIKTTVRVKTPGKSLSHIQQNRFASFDEPSEKSIVSPSKTTPLTGVWAQKPNIFDQAVVTMPITVPVLPTITREVLVSSPHDQALLERKRLNQLKSTKRNRSWADMADSDDSDSDDDVPEEGQEVANN